MLNATKIMIMIASSIPRNARRMIVQCTCDSRKTIVLTRFDRTIIARCSQDHHKTVVLSSQDSCTIITRQLYDHHKTVVRQSYDSRALSQEIHMDRAAFLLPTDLCLRSVFDFKLGITIIVRASYKFKINLWFSIPSPRTHSHTHTGQTKTI